MSVARAVRFVGNNRLARTIARRLSVGWKDRLKQWAGMPAAPTPPAPLPNVGPSGDSVVSNHWDKQASDAFIRDMTRRSWSGVPQTHLNHNYLITGRRDYYWIRYLRDRYFPSGNAGDVLSLGCGEGHVDRIWPGEGLAFRSFTGIDISPASVRKAQELAEQMHLAPKITYFTADLNRYTIPLRSYDFIYFFQSLHHIEALEPMLSSCAKALRPGGLLLVNEFVGPTRFQWTRLQVEMADHLLSLLPPELRVDLLAGDNRLKTKSVTPTEADMIAGDPSEAVRSADIERVLKERFEIIEEKNWGGTLTYLIFENIAGNFNPKNPLHECIIELLIHHENVLIQNKVLPSDFKVYMARPR